LLFVRVEWRKPPQRSLLKLMIPKRLISCI
jgi:hypothetical protein